MKLNTILVPIDVESCPLEVFSYINQFAGDDGAKITLLHVSKLNIVAPENRLYPELARELEALLRRLQTKFISPRLDSRVSVRFGQPADEIVAEAGERAADLIVLTKHSKRRSRGWFHVDVVDEVVAAAPCAVNVVRVNTRFDCRSDWGRADAVVEAINAAKSYWQPETIYATA